MLLGRLRVRVRAAGPSGRVAADGAPLAGAECCDRGAATADRLADAAALAPPRRDPVRTPVGGHAHSSPRTSSRRRYCGSSPLAIYLASFIIAFSPRGGSTGPAGRRRRPAMITLLWVPYGSAGGWPILVILAMELVAFGVVAVALHGRLAQDRPDPSHLTEFYLILAAGGALASALRRGRCPDALRGHLGVPDPAGRGARRAGPRPRPRRHAPRRGHAPAVSTSAPFLAGFRGAARCRTSWPSALLLIAASSRPAHSRPRPASAGCSSAA